MRNYLLVAINSQYIHTNLAVRYLKKYAEEFCDTEKVNVEIYETNINNQILNMIKDIYEKRADVIIFSTYIWNREITFKIIKELKKILPKTKIGMGGPEVSYDSLDILKKNPQIDFIIKGEGERGFLKIISQTLENISGVYDYPVPYELDEIPFPYTEEELKGEKKILYYESSRGCPFSCSYCLSSIDTGIKYFSIERVKNDLRAFLHSDIKLIKFVDRTFNINKGRYLEIWKFLIENYREGIVFHFEINANLFDDETVKIFEKIPENYFQFEIGIQSINWETMESINRKNLIDKLSENIKKIPKNIHLHLDLIAGLPFETYNLFKNSFNYVYDLKPEMIQLGFLKLLKGTKMLSDSSEYEYQYTEFPPYEILSNKYIKYEEISKLKEIETILDLYYNSEKFEVSLNYIIKNFYDSPFKFFEDISLYFKEKQYLDIGHKIHSLFNYLYEFYKEKNFSEIDIFREYLKYDYLVLGKPGVYPSWFKSIKNSDLHDEIIKKEKFTSAREGYKNSELEIFEYNIFQNKEEKMILFVNYKEKKVKIIE